MNTSPSPVRATEDKPSLYKITYLSTEGKPTEALMKTHENARLFYARFLELGKKPILSKWDGKVYRPLKMGFSISAPATVPTAVAHPLPLKKDSHRAA